MIEILDKNDKIELEKKIENAGRSATADAEAAAASASAAQTAQGKAETAQGEAEASAEAAAASASAAQTAQGRAETAQGEAEAAQEAAETANTEAGQKAAEAENAAQEATQAATEAKNAQTAASDSATNAEASEEAAATSETNAAKSATAAAGSATTASNAATAAQTAQGKAEAAQAAAESLKEEVEQKLANGELDGEDGVTPVFEIDEIVTLEAGERATVDIDNAAPTKPKISFGIPKGADGKTPVKGVDYYTTEEKAALVSELSQIPTPKIVSSVEEMTDTTKHYVLGNSIYAYMPTVKTVKTYTNLYDHAKMSSADFNLNHRYNSSHALVEANGYLLLDKLPVSHVNGAILTVRTKGAPRQEAGHSYCRIQLYDKNGGVISFANSAIPNATTGWSVKDEGNGVYAYYQAINYDVGAIWIQLFISSSAISASDVANLIVAVNQEIKEETVTTYDWVDSGISYTPTFKTDIIGVLGENNVIYLSDNALPSGTYTLKADNANYDIIGTYTKE